MYYGFVDGKYIGQAEHIKYLKRIMEDDLKLFGGCFAVIYRGEQCWQVRDLCSIYNTDWHFFRSSKKERPDLPTWARKR